MAVVNILPNGVLVITLSPREAVLFNDELLPPGEFPWQNSESEMIALEIKQQIKHLVEQQQHEHTNMLSGMVTDIDQRRREEEMEKRAELNRRAEELLKKKQEQQEDNEEGG
jgi:hypothetical protein